MPSIGKPESLELNTEEIAANDLLQPILIFLAAAGVGSDTVFSAFKNAWEVANAITPKVKIGRLSSIVAYTNIVSTWGQHPTYLNNRGRPKALPFAGKNSFTELVESVDPNLAPKDALGELVKYGNVLQLPKGKIKLTKSFFHFRSDSALAFEPSVRFLLDASATVNSIIKGTQAENSEPERFWRVVSSPKISSDLVSAYLDFARRRTLVCLQEIDEWLRAHESQERADGEMTRVGLGVFSIHSEPLG